MNAEPAISVLIVDDQGPAARDLQGRLKDLGYDAFAIAASGEEAVRLAQARRPDVVLMDIPIRGAEDGIEAARRLRATFEVPVVFLTAHADDVTLERARRVEPYGYLVKPVGIDEVRAAIEVASFKHAREQRARAEDRFYAQALDSLADGVLCTDNAGCVTFVSSAAEKLTGVSRLDAVGFPLDDVVRRRRVEGETLSELVNARSGDTRIVRETPSAVLDGGRLAGTVIVLRDVTDERSAQQGLEVAERSAALSRLAAGVAHEVNNPLAVIAVNSTFAKEELAAHLEDLTGQGVVLGDAALGRVADLTRLLSAMDRAAWMVAKVVSDLRTLSLPPRQTTCVANVARAAGWAARSTSPLLDAVTQLVVDVPDDLCVATEDHRLGQVIVNLVTNAAQAMTDRDPSRNLVKLLARSHGARVLVEVSDNGAGIAEELLGRIFDPFFTTRAVGVGAGLGLSIVNGIVTSVGGTVTVTSKLGAGTTFRLDLPAANHA